jgi:hypothetical protein
MITKLVILKQGSGGLLVPCFAILYIKYILITKSVIYV